jgi:AmiR/NasT family two-component response regulator
VVHPGFGRVADQDVGSAGAGYARPQVRVNGADALQPRASPSRLPGISFDSVLPATKKPNGEAGERLRILVADGRGKRLDEVASTVVSLGHEVVGEASLGDVAALTASILPDAAIVIVGESSEHALDLIGKIVTEAACPVIAILDVEDEGFIHEAAKRGIFAYITQGQDAAALQSSLDVVLVRFAEYHGLEGAFARRAITERAKGILMERHSVDEKQAFEMLREQARRTNRKITDIAEAVALSVTLLPSQAID